jgi:hypothetical protein
MKQTFKLLFIVVAVLHKLHVVYHTIYPADKDPVKLNLARHLYLQYLAATHSSFTFD